MKFLSQRTIFLLCFLTVVILMGIVAYLEKYKGFLPCPLCLLQRYVFIILGVIFLIGALFTLRKYSLLIISFLGLLFSSLGAALAGRQVWLQHLPPDQFSDCGASLEYMLQALPIKEVLQKVFAGSAECSTVGSSFLFLSLAEWSLLIFIGFIIISAWQFIRGTVMKHLH